MNTRTDIMAAAYIAQLALELACELNWQKTCPEHSPQSARLLGQTSGFMLKWAHQLVDDGADPKDVRELINIGMRANRRWTKPSDFPAATAAAKQEEETSAAEI